MTTLPDPASGQLIILTLRGCPNLRLNGQPVNCGHFGLRVLAVLALDGPTERLKLADLLWDTTTERALHNLRMALHKLRRTLGHHAHIITDQHGRLHLDLTRVNVDVLHTPLTRPAEFMSGHRTRGTETWLEWANHQEKQLKNHPHVQPSCSGQHLQSIPPHGNVIRGDSSLLPFPVTPTSFPMQLAVTQLTHQATPTRPATRRPGSLALLYALDAAAELDNGQYAQAAEAAHQALELCPTGEGAALAHDTLAYLALEQDEFQQSRQHIREGFQAHTDPPCELFYTAASLADLQGQYSRAEQLTLQGLKVLRPHSSPALLQAVTASTYDSRADHWPAFRSSGRATASAHCKPAQRAARRLAGFPIR